MTVLPAALTQAPSWLVWSLVKMADKPKPLKIPYYVSGALREGNQGSAPDREAMASFDAALSAWRGSAGRYSGVGLAMLGQGVVALDFDNVVVNGVIDPRVLPLIEGTYSEFSPSGNGVRAFFSGSLRDRKSIGAAKGNVPYDVEFFCNSGFVTVTGHVTPLASVWGWDAVVAPLSDTVKELYKTRFGVDPDADGFLGSVDTDDWLMTAATKVGWSIEQARAYVDVMDPECSRQEWLNVGMSLHHEFEGSTVALELFDEWSKRGGDKYAGRRDVEARWASFGRHGGQPLTAAWLLKHSKVAKVAQRYEAVGEWQATIAGAADQRVLVEDLSVRVRGDERLGELEREQIAQCMLERLRTFGVKLPIAKVRELVTPVTLRVPTVQQRRPLTEFGNAERMLDRYGASLMYVPELASWYTWNGVYWKMTTNVEIEHYAKETIRGLVAEAGDFAEQGAAEFFEWCALSQQARMVRNMVSLASSDPRVCVPAGELDKDPWLLGVQNGVVDLRTGELLPPLASRHITKCCVCDYNPLARAGLFRQTVMDAFFDSKDMFDFLQRVIGYAAMGRPIEEVMVIAWGNGSNGKSSVFGTVRHVLGTYAKSAAPETFMTDGLKASGSGGGPREDLVRLRGSRFVYVNEPDEGAELKEGLVKNLTGGDEITARGINAKHSMDFMPTWVAVMPTNHKPIIKGSDNGIWRRMLLIPFTRNFREDKTIVEDKNRKEKLLSESEGVLAYIVEGCRAYAGQGLAPPVGVRTAAEQYRSQMDVLGEWIEDRCETASGYSESIQNLWKSWEAFATDRGGIGQVRSSISLGRRLEQRFPSGKDAFGKRIRLGIRLKGIESDADEFFR